jgi:hypothetical protein
MSVASPPPLDPRNAGNDRRPVDAIPARWAAVRQAAAVVAALAGLPGELRDEQSWDLSARLETAQGWRRALAVQALDDLTAVMQPGLAALLSLHARGADTGIAAQALWEEFAAARGALLALVSRDPRHRG